MDAYSLATVAARLQQDVAFVERLIRRNILETVTTPTGKVACTEAQVEDYLQRKAEAEALVVRLLSETPEERRQRVMDEAVTYTAEELAELREEASAAN